MHETNQNKSFIPALFITTSLLVVGFLLEVVLTSQAQFNILWPINAIIGIGFLLVTTVFHFLFKHEQWFRYLRSTQNSIVIIGAYLLLVIIMGSFTQVDAMASNWVRKFGLSHITSSWPFILLNVYFLFVLALVTLQRFRPFNLRNIAFVANHVGLWIVVATVGLGVGDLQRLRMSVDTNDAKPIWYASHQKDTIELPLAVRLLHFEIEEYMPKLTLVDNKTGQVVAGQGKNMLEVEVGAKSTINDWEITILKYLPESSEVGNAFYRVNELGAAPAAFVQIKTDTKTDSSWVSCGSFNRVPFSFKLDSTYSLVMTVPEPKKYQSEVIIYTPQGEKDTVLLEVNKAHTVNGYKLYQLGFDEKYGKWSTTSILEVVHDPWQPLVYFGIFMMLAGAVYLFFWGAKANNSLKGSN